MRRKDIAKGLLAAVLLVIGGGALFVAAVYLLLSDPAPLRTINPETTAFIDRKCAHRPCPLRFTPLKEISPFLPEAVVLAEDARFMLHRGIDWRNVRYALLANLRAKRIVWGGSSITMQLAKNLYLGPEKTAWRKLREVLLAIKLERSLSKERILELYLNVAEWGPDLFGVGNAAERYFHKAPGDLTPFESAFLASILPRPEMADRGEMPERFADAGGRLFSKLIEHHLGLAPIDELPASECRERLTDDEAFRLDYLIAKIFNAHAHDIRLGGASLMSRKELEAALAPEERAFIDSLLARFSAVRAAVPLPCARSAGAGDLAAFDQTDALGARKVFWLPGGSVDDLQRLLTEAADAGILLKLNSAYRAEGYQIFILLSTLRQHGYCLSDAVRKVAHPAESEHGCTDELTVDLGDGETNRLVVESDPSFAWLRDNAARHHFFLSYPKEGSSMAFEPWHWRHKTTGR